MRLSIICHKLSLLKDLKKRCQGLFPLLTQPNLSEEMVEYYRTGESTEYVFRADGFQVKRCMRRILILYCFISYQHRSGTPVSPDRYSP
jgi:hypothetical protein